MILIYFLPSYFSLVVLVLPWSISHYNCNFFCRYLFCCSYTHNVAPKGKFIAFVSTEAETDHPESELKPGIDLLGPVDEIFFDTYDRLEPVNEPTLDHCFISTVSSYNASLLFHGQSIIDSSFATELWCYHSFWINGHGCAFHVHEDHRKGKLIMKLLLLFVYSFLLQNCGHRNFY